jgi:hypothetical protein
VPEGGSVVAASVERGGIRARTLGFFGVAFAALMSLGGYITYRELLHYERRALRHVPLGAELVARVDLEQVRLFEPVRRHLLPLVDQPSPGLALPDAPGASSRLTRLREQGVLNLALDLREIVFARRAAGGWVLALGGMFDRDGLVAGIERVLASEPSEHVRRDAGILILEPWGVALGQAEDGVLLLGSDREVLLEALPESPHPASFGALGQGVASIAALGSWLQPWLKGTGASSELLASVTRVNGQLELGEPHELTLRVELSAAAEATQLRGALEARLGGDAAAGFVPSADWGGERAVLARSRFEQRTSAEIEISSTWQRGELDHAARSLATWLRAHLQTHGPGVPRAPSAGHEVPPPP